MSVLKTFTDLSKEYRKQNSLNKIRQTLYQIPRLHCGGCAISALAIKRWLKKYKNIDSEVVYEFDDGNMNLYYGVMNSINNNTPETMSSCVHAGVQIYNDSVIFDAEKVWYPSQFNPIITIKEEFLLPSINTKLWNPWFNRSHVFDMQRDLNIDLSDVIPDYNKLLRKKCDETPI